jgi:outer membrane murein-binding lipoprotein Lpp
MQWRPSPEQRVDQLESKVHRLSNQIDQVDSELQRLINALTALVEANSRTVQGLFESVKTLSQRVQVVEDVLIDKEMAQEAQRRLDDPDAKVVPYTGIDHAAEPEGT